MNVQGAFFSQDRAATHEICRFGISCMQTAMISTSFLFAIPLALMSSVDIISIDFSFV